MCCLFFINYLDAGAGRLGGLPNILTASNQMVNATFMNIADDHTNFLLPRRKIPVLQSVTGISDGRMEKFYWAPN